MASGGVAPVDKTVTYGAVSTTLFGGTKCAITRNLGAATQAGSSTDDTEASAGWYWQFNRKQGYKHDGTTPTPAWTITSIIETSDWVSVNDPCTIELGAGWRLLTDTEWAAADASWNNYNDTYASVLALHAAGYINNDGSLYHRGINPFGDYCCSVQRDALTCWSMYFDLNNSFTAWSAKAIGFNARCIRDLLPTLTTTTVTSITTATASSGGNVTDDGGSTITARGVCWSTTANPVATGSHTTDAGTTGVFTSSITGLSASTLYHVRAYATNAIVAGYGSDLTFYTTGCFIAGTQISMADGSVKNIEDVLVGDEVKSVNTETMEIVTETVTNTFANPPAGNLTKITFSNGQTNTNTKNHPYWVIGKGWSCVDPATFSASKVMSAELLTVGDQCMILENGNFVTVTITSIEDQPQITAPTFNFKVNQTNCYFANGVLVHNKI
ncbi:MAG: polymorphic toxin-type HINT domain-containing protein [Bacteroidota bacterium]